MHAAKPLKLQPQLTSDELRKLITVTRPKYEQVGCCLCRSGNQVRLIESTHTGESLMLCKLCLVELAKRNISNVAVQE